MPQDELLQDQPEFDGYRLSWEEQILTGGRVWACHVQRRSRQNGWETVHVSQWEGVMMDLASTMAEDCQNAFFYDDRRGLAKAATTVVRLARRHQRRYSRL